MKITINSRVLKSALESAIKGISPKPTISILGNFLLEGDGQYLTITGSDTAVTIREKVPCEATERAVIPTSLLELVRTLPDGEVGIETDDTTARIAWKNGQSTIPCYDAKEYPETKSYNGEYLAIKGASFADAFAFTIPHISGDELRPVMSGVFFNAKDDGVTDVVASDSHTLALYKLKTDHKEPFSFVIPASAIKFIIPMTSRGDVEMGFDEKDIFFRVGDAEIIAHKIEGKFPRYESIIPTGVNSVFKADKAILTGAIKRALVCASKASGRIKLSLGMLETSIEAQDLSLGTSSREILENASFDGADLTIGFKGGLLLKCISAVPDAEVKINLTEANRAAVIKTDDENAIALIMPVQL